MTSTIQALIVVGIMLWIVVWGVRSHRRETVRRALVAQIRQTGAPLFLADWSTRAVITALNGRRTAWNAVIAVTPDHITVYRIVSGRDERVSFTAENLRWFGRPRKYHAGTNEIWLHIEQDGGWHLVAIRLSKLDMHALVRALKEIAAPELTTAYRRRRPYIHVGPLAARPAVQDIHGAWTLEPPVSLYLTPLWLVLLDGAAVRRTIALETIQRVSAIRRLDQPRADGLVRFEVDGAPVAFALRQYETFAAQLAEAAKRTLEDPVVWQRKKKKDGEWDEEFE